MVGRRQRYYRDFRPDNRGRGAEPNNRPTDRGDRHHHRHGSEHPLHLLLGHVAAAYAGNHRGRANRPRAYLRIGHDGVAEYSLLTDHLDHHRALDRDRSGLHHPCDSSLQRGILSFTRPGESGYPYPHDNRIGIAGLRTDDSVGIWSADSLAAARFPAVWHHRYNHDRLFVDGFRICGAARNGGVGRVPEHAATFYG